MRSGETLESPRRGRGWLRPGLITVLALVVLGIVCVVGFLAYDELRARSYARRIREVLESAQSVHEGTAAARVIERNLHALALLERPAGGWVLEKYASDPRMGTFQTLALKLLCAHYPDTFIARGAREYERICGRSYFGRKFSWNQRWIDRLAVDEAKARQLRLWLRAYSDHPGADDVLMILAGTELTRERRLEALVLLHEALHAPDGDCRLRASTNVRYILDRRCHGDELSSWLEGECPHHLRGLVLYAAAVHSLREKKFGRASSQLEKLLARKREESCLDLDEFAREETWNKIEAQQDSCRWFAARQKEYDDADGEGQKRASLLHVMARRCFHRPELFRNVFVSPMPRIRWRLGAAGLPDELTGTIPTDSGYRHATDYFITVAREYPSYGDLEAVEYSIPLCLWRVKVDTRPRRDEKALDLAIADGFQRFADKYPESSLADEALYSAAVHVFWAVKDQERMFANMRRIARSHRDGNIAREYAKRNKWLRLALSEEASP